MIVVSIVILNWKSYPVVMDAAASAMAQRGVKTELIVVDNGSKDGSVDKLRQSYPLAKIVELGYNSGFAIGMNTGLKHASSDYVLLQNADLILDEDYCRLAVEAMSADPGLGAVGGIVNRLVNGLRTDVLDACGYVLSTQFRVRFLASGTEEEVLGVSGSCPFLRMRAARALAADVGYVLDPWYFTYFEDVDLMLRLNLAGWKVRYMPSMRAWHVRSGSTAVGSRFYQKPLTTLRHHLKNRLATVIKAAPGWLLRRWFLPLILVECAIPFYLILRRPRGVAAWARSWAAVVREGRRLLRDRHRLLARATPEAHTRLRSLLSSRFVKRSPAGLGVPRGEQ